MIRKDPIMLRITLVLIIANWITAAENTEELNSGSQFFKIKSILNKYREKLQARQDETEKNIFLEQLKKIRGPITKEMIKTILKMKENDKRVVLARYRDGIIKLSIRRKIHHKKKEMRMTDLADLEDMHKAIMIMQGGWWVGGWYGP